MTGEIDLHLHTHYSDGTNSPGEIIELVREKRLSAFSICDHDNLGGYFEAREILGEGGPELVPGVELSTGDGLEDIHMLGYFFDPNSSLLGRELDNFRINRNRRGAEMLKKLSNLGIDLSYDEVKRIAGKSAIGRPNIADALVQAGAVRSFEEAFVKYIGLRGPAYVPKKNLTPREAIDLIHEAGGVAILAHPGIANAGKYIEEFITCGLDGIEAYHPNHNSRLQKRYLQFAREKSILATGGSDYHGRSGRYGDIGCMHVPRDLLDIMKERMRIISGGSN